MPPPPRRYRGHADRQAQGLRVRWRDLLRHQRLWLSGAIVSGAIVSGTVVVGTVSTALSGLGPSSNRAPATKHGRAPHRRRALGRRPPRVPESHLPAGLPALECCVWIRLCKQDCIYFRTNQENKIVQFHSRDESLLLLFYERDFVNTRHHQALPLAVPCMGQVLVSLVVVPWAKALNTSKASPRARRGAKRVTQGLGQAQGFWGLVVCGWKRPAQAQVLYQVSITARSGSG